MVIQRTIANSVIEMSKYFYVLLLTGPRQVGKTTLLKSLQSTERSYVSLDDMDRRIYAEKDPAGFVNNLKLPVLIDEIQYAPGIFPYIKMLVDKINKPGLIWMTGSQQFDMMKNVNESLAGRIAILDMLGISLAEEENRADTPPFLPTSEALRTRDATGKVLTETEIYHKIWRGSFPKIVTAGGAIWETFHESYITTYLERDVRDFLKVGDLMTFRHFIQIAAARTGQLVNYRDISKEVGVSEPTVKSWYNILRMANIVHFVQPYYTNISKRLIKTPKAYFTDTGLVCCLTRWTNPDVLSKGAMAGAILETYVVSEIIKSYIHNGKKPPIYFYRDKDKREVDLLIHQGEHFYPIEIKKASSIYNSGFKGFDFLSDLQVDHGCVLSFNSGLTSYDSKIDIVPIGLL